VGIKDVAKVAGVSITTVSHALSGKGRLPDRTRERVRAIAAELGYTPHPIARSLARGRTGLLATVVSVPGNAPLAFTEIDY
jgi:DNA-binding LacI/PurR family transcriptional regulator